MASEAGKGSKPRPLSVSQDVFDERFDAIFRKAPYKVPSPAEREYELNKSTGDVQLKADE